MRIYASALDLIGNTPLVKMERYMAESGLNAAILAKLERANPAGSSKDRVGLAMIRRAEEQGLLTSDSVIIEPTSGNTGIGLAAAASILGYRVILTMPETMSMERRQLLRAYGAELVLTKGELGMAGAIEKAKALAASLPHSFLPSQFDNPANPDIHYQTTGPEIWNDTDGKVDIFVAGAGTGGTITGVGRYLKEKNPDIQIIAVEPASSPVLSGGIAGPHKLQGIGAGFVPKNLDTAVIDKVICVGDEEAYTACKSIARLEGLLVGITSGAAIHAASVLAQDPSNHGKTIVALLPDSGERYLSTGVFD